MLQSLSAGEGVTLVQIKACVDDLVLFDLRPQEAATVPNVMTVYTTIKRTRKKEYENVKQMYNSEAKRRARVVYLDNEVMMQSIYECVGLIRNCIDKRHQMTK